MDYGELLRLCLQSAWVIQSIKRLPSASVVISGPGIRPESGSLLSGESASPSVSTVCPHHLCCLSLSNKYIKSLKKKTPSARDHIFKAFVMLSLGWLKANSWGGRKCSSILVTWKRGDEVF